MFPPPSEAPGPTDCGETSGSLGGLARAQSCAPYRGAPGRRDPLPATWGHEAPASGGQRRSRLASAVNVGSDAPRAPLTRGQTCPPSPGPFPTARHRHSCSFLLPVSTAAAGAARPRPARPGFPAAAPQRCPPGPQPGRRPPHPWSPLVLPPLAPPLAHFPCPTWTEAGGSELGRKLQGSARNLPPPPHSPAGPPEGQWPCEGRAHGAGLARTEDTSDPADLQSHD